MNDDMARQCDIILVDDDPNDDRWLREGVLELKLKSGWNMHTCFSLKEGLRAIVERHFNVCLLDLSFPATKEEPASNSEQTISLIHTIAPVLPVCVLTGHEEEAGYLGPCIEAGAMNYFVKQFYFENENRLSFLHGIRMARLLHPHRRFNQ